MSDSSVLWSLSLAFTVIGTVLGVVMYRPIRRRRNLLRTGVSALGVVIDLEPAHLGSSSGRGTLVYYPVISWVTADDRPMETKPTMGRPREDTFPIGTELEVRYDPTNPSDWMLPEESTNVFRVFTVVGAAFVATGLGCFFWALLSPPL